MSTCTCSKCIGGFLSPRNAAMLRDTATASAELLRDSLPPFPGGGPVHDPEVFLLNYVSPDLRMEVRKEFADGFANCMDSIAYVLKQGQVPKPRMVAQCAPVVPGADKSATSFYLSNGGTAEYAIDAVVGQCEEAASQDLPDSVAALPECANDGKWDCVRQNLFCTSEFWPCGPYPMDDEGAWGEDAGVDSGDGWVHYDTSNWKPPSKS